MKGITISDHKLNIKTKPRKRNEMSHMQLLRLEYSVARTLRNYHKITNRYPLCN